MAKALEVWRKKSPDLVGSTLGSQTDRFRLETVSVFMACGLPLSKIDGLHDYLLKHSKLQLFDVSHLRTYITLDRCVDRINAIVQNSNYFSVIFDGSSRVDEVLADILRYALCNVH